MKGKLLVFIVMAVFSSNVFAEYYLVYPVSTLPCETCYHKTYYKKHHASKTYKKKHHTVSHKKRHHRHYTITEYIPCGAIVRCSTCGEYVSSNCGRPDYIVYTARSSDCETYEGVQQGEQYGEW